MKTLKQTISACKFDYVNKNITDKNFPDFKEMPNEPTELIGFGKNLSSEDVLDRLEKDGKRPANAKELLSFALKNPEEQRKYPIVALGSSCEVDGLRYSPYLWGNSSRRRLSLGWTGGGWDSCCRFLVHKSSPSDTRSKGHQISTKDYKKLLNILDEATEILSKK